MDKDALACVAKSLFGADLKFNEYYRKFVHRNISLPEPEEETMKEFCLSLYNTYIKSDELSKQGRYSYIQLGRDGLGMQQQLCEALNLTPRQIHEVYRIIAHVFVCDEDKEGQLRWGYLCIAFVMAALSLTDTELYKKMGNESLTIEELGVFLDETGLLVENGDPSEWWLFSLGAATQTNESVEQQRLAKVCQEYDLLADVIASKGMDEANSQLRASLDSYLLEGFGSRIMRSNTPAMRMYKQIEEVVMFTQR